jgi:hypothetical protein
MGRALIPAWFLSAKFAKRNYRSICAPDGGTGGTVRKFSPVLFCHHHIHPVCPLFLDSSDVDPAHALQVDTEQHSQGSVYRLTVARPERLNIVDTVTLTEMSNALARIADDDGRPAWRRKQGLDWWRRHQ